jgi:glucose-1-phosphate adenylyltransferase
MAGGKGERLYPLTKERSKPAVPFGGKFRIIDFVLSNFVHSGILSTYVLVQYMSQSLIEYLRMSWRGVGLTRHQFLTVVPPQMRLGDRWYRGTADAVLQNLNLINDFDPDLVAVFGADHVYRMDVGQMIDFHLETGAEATVAAIPVPIKQASSFGIITADSRHRMTSFDEKPKNPNPMKGDRKMAYASMGNYLFNRDTLVRLLTKELKSEGELDFGKHVIPAIYKKGGVFTYDFATNVMPGVKSFEEKGYWRDIGTIQAFWRAHMDLLGDRPVLDLDNKYWPINSPRYDGPIAKVLGAKVDDSMLGEGCVVKKATVRRSLLGRGVVVHDGCVIEDSIIMDSCELKPGTHVKRTIMDRFNVIAPKTMIGYDAEKDAKRYYVDPSGIVVLPRGRPGLTVFH